MNATSGARTVSGSAAILNPVSWPATIPRPCRRTKSPSRYVNVAEITPCHVPGGSRTTSLPRISSVTLPGIEMRSTSAAVSTGWVPTSPNIAERLQVLHQRRVTEPLIGRVVPPLPSGRGGQGERYLRGGQGERTERQVRERGTGGEVPERGSG